MLNIQIVIISLEGAHRKPIVTKNQEQEGNVMEGETIYHIIIARNFGREVKLVVWRSFSEPPNLIPLKCLLCTGTYGLYSQQTAKFKFHQCYHIALWRPNCQIF